MLQVESRFIAKAKEARDGADLQALLQKALRLEHSTIPPYLTAAFSLKRGSNGEVFATLKEIALEEMLHMAIVANVINAIGGKPDIAREEFIPKYPGPLPMTIGELVVGLKKFSRELVHDVFMKMRSRKPHSFSPSASWRRRKPNSNSRRLAHSIRRSRKGLGSWATIFSQVIRRAKSQSTTFRHGIF